MYARYIKFLLGRGCSMSDTRNQNQVQGPAVSFLADETAGFCLTAHAGPSQAV
jgi:hypothetical protein